MMRRLARLAAAALLATGGWSASPLACDLPATSGDRPPALLRKPVLGDDVLLTAGFGLRLHPLLGMHRMHNGIDWAAAVGTPVVAAASGRVVQAGAVGEFGNVVVIEHGAGWQSLYAHLARIHASEGDCVEAGAAIGLVGSTGLTAGPGLHYEVHLHGAPIDPLTLPAR